MIFWRVYATTAVVLITSMFVSFGVILRLACVAALLNILWDILRGALDKEI